MRDAFAEVQRAEQDQAKLINEADQYANQKIRRAEGEAAKIVEDAKAYKSQVVLEAQGEAQRFISVYDEYSKAKDVTRERLYLETLEEVMTKSNKVLIEGENGSGVVPYLPLARTSEARRDHSRPRAKPRCREQPSNEPVQNIPSHCGRGRRVRRLHGALPGRPARKRIGPALR